MSESLFPRLFQKYETAFQKLELNESVQARLIAYLDYLWERNQTINLVSRKMEPETLVTDHLLDSLIGLPHIPKDVASIADLGTGGGFPAIPLAICLPETRFILYEKSPLKREYLNVLQELCPNTEVEGLLDEQLDIEDVDLVIARGFKPIAQILRVTKAHFHRGGRYVLYKARRSRIEEELAAAPKGLQAELIALEPYGDAEERHLVVF